MARSELCIHGAFCRFVIFSEGGLQLIVKIMLEHPLQVQSRYSSDCESIGQPVRVQVGLLQHAIRCLGNLSLGNDINKLLIAHEKVTQPNPLESNRAMLLPREFAQWWSPCIHIQESLHCYSRFCNSLLFGASYLVGFSSHACC